MVEISLCMIVKNEEELLQSCLESVADLCDEIIIVDTGSTDKTKAIATMYTDRIFDFTWIDDFSAARNFSFQQATKDFIFWLDADDLLLKKDREQFARLKEELDKSIDAVSMLYHTAFDEYGKPYFSFRRHRLVKRTNQFKWIGAVHEYLAVSGNILASPIAITHRKHQKVKVSNEKGRNLRIYENQRKKGVAFSPRDLFYYANELKDHHQLEQAISIYREFLDTNKGWVEDRIRACLYTADCYRALKQPDKEMEALLASLMYDIPRPETSCRIGDLYKEKKKYKQAVFWYELALNNVSENEYSFHNRSFSTWYPHLQLCVCYWKLGQLEIAMQHNEKAKLYRPTDRNVLLNEQFFKNVFAQK